MYAFIVLQKQSTALLITIRGIVGEKMINLTHKQLVKTPHQSCEPGGHDWVSMDLPGEKDFNPQSWAKVPWLSIYVFTMGKGV